jgi:uncharacterized protein DUF3108
MKLAAPLILLLCLNSPPAAHHAIAEQLNYTFEVVGLPLAEATLNIDLAEVDYRASLQFHTVGLANVVDGGSLQESVNGELRNNRPAPQSFAANGYLHGQNRIVEMVWRDGTPMTTAIAPPNAREREDVPLPLRAGAADQVSLIVSLLHTVDQTGRCESSARSYDGRDLQLFQVRTIGEEDLRGAGGSGFTGRALRCDFTDQTLAGFRFGQAGVQDHRLRRGTVWLARLVSGGPRWPVRAAFETRWFGEATIYLTSAPP